MPFRHKIMGAAALGALMLTAACTTNPETGNKRISRAAIGGVAGAVGGYLLGDLIGGKRDRTEKIVGAGIGAVAGAGGVGAHQPRAGRVRRQHLESGASARAAAAQPAAQAGEVSRTALSLSVHHGPGAGGR